MGKRVASIKIGRRIEKTEDNQYGWQKDCIVPYDEPCVVVLGGDGCDDDRKANGYAKEIEKDLLIGLGKKVPVYSVVYEKVPCLKGKISSHMYTIIQKIKHRADVLEKRTEQGEVFAKKIKQGLGKELQESYIDDLYEKLIEPRITQYNGEYDIEVRIPVAEACRRMRMLNIVTHCFGGYIALELEQKMKEQMKLLGYSLEERKEILSQFLIMEHNPMHPLGVAKSQAISFSSVKDIAERSDIYEKNFFNAYLANRWRSEKSYNKDKENNITSENTPFNLTPCYFAQNRLFLVKQKYGEGAKFSPIDDKEHNTISKGAKLNSDAKVMMDIYKNILCNGVRNSIENSKQEAGTYVALPPISQLVLSGNEKSFDMEEERFQDMWKEGDKWRFKAYKFAKKYRSRVIEGDKSYKCFSPFER